MVSDQSTNDSRIRREAQGPPSSSTSYADDVRDLQAASGSMKGHERCHTEFAMWRGGATAGADSQSSRAGLLPRRPAPNGRRPNPAWRRSTDLAFHSEWGAHNGLEFCCAPSTHSRERGPQPHRVSSNSLLKRGVGLLTRVLDCGRLPFWPRPRRTLQFQTTSTSVEVVITSGRCDTVIRGPTPDDIYESESRQAQPPDLHHAVAIIGLTLS